MFDSKAPNPELSAAGPAPAATCDQAISEQDIPEVRRLLGAAQVIDDLSRRVRARKKVPRAEINRALVDNRDLWRALLGQVMKPDCPLPAAWRRNMALSGMVIFTRTIEALVSATPGKLSRLSGINRRIAGGLQGAAF